MMMMMIGIRAPGIMGPSFLSVLGSTESVNRIIIDLKTFIKKCYVRTYISN